MAPRAALRLCLALVHALALGGCSYSDARARVGVSSAPAVAPSRAVDRAGDSRFFLHGDGQLRLRNAHTGEGIEVRFRGGDGSYAEDALRRIDALFRSRGDGRTRGVALRLIELLDYVEDRFRPRALALLSGYRSPEYNDAIRGRGAQAAKASMHTEGLAADLRFEGVDMRQLWEEIRAIECCGAGYYASGSFLHLDVGRPRFWEETTSRVKENLSAGNARVFARTEFDRYGTASRARVSLHSVTLYPLRIHSTARLLPEEATGPVSNPVAMPLELAHAREEGVLREGDCFVISGPPFGDVHRFIAPLGAGAALAAGRYRLELETCSPRLEATPAGISTNRVELGAASAASSRSGERDPLDAQ